MQFFDVDEDIKGAETHLKSHPLVVLRRSTGGNLHAIRFDDEPCEICKAFQNKKYTARLLFASKGTRWAGPWVDPRSGREIMILPRLLVHFVAPLHNFVEHVFLPFDSAPAGRVYLAGAPAFFGVQLANVAPDVRFPLRTDAESLWEHDLDQVVS